MPAGEEIAVECAPPTMSADPATESLTQYLARRLVAEKGFVPGHVAEADAKAAQTDAPAATEVTP